MPGQARPERLTLASLDAVPGLLPALLALNNVHAVELSELSEGRFRHLVGAAFLAQHVGRADALMIAFDQAAGYDSPNFLWFRARYPRFVYVDRIVTAAAARGRGLARALYAALTAQARAAGHTQLVCEVNADPPNPGSDAMHHRLGFRAVGSARLMNGKTVTYLARPIGPARPT